MPEYKDDFHIIPDKPMKWEWILFIYIVFTGVLVWYVVENLLVWDPGEIMWGLPKPIAGAFMISITWGLATVVLAPIYYFVLKRRYQKFKQEEGG